MELDLRLGEVLVLVFVLVLVLGIGLGLFIEHTEHYYLLPVEKVSKARERELLTNGPFRICLTHNILVQLGHYRTGLQCSQQGTFWKNHFIYRVGRCDSSTCGSTEPS